MADGVFGHPGPIAQGHVGQGFRAQRDHATTQSKLSAQSFLTFYSRSLRYLWHWKFFCVRVLSAGATARQALNTSPSQLSIPA